MSEKSKSTFITEANRYQDVNISWLEWKDSDLTNEKWETPRNGPDGLFLDTERIMMPRSLEPYQWIRAKDLKHLTGSLTVYTMAVGYPDLITRNKHLLHSEFVRWFISALTNLQHYGHDGLEISGENSNFVWTSRHESWHGWLHVYSMNKAGKGVQHRPVINPNGKYIVRLHYMGCWRRILIDDTVPVDKDGMPLLPRTSNNIELWPILLAKALLKIASLSWTERREIVDFHPITCLTGWICLTLSIKYLSSQDKWDLLTKYSERFEWTPRTASGYISIRLHFQVENTKNATSNKTRRSNETLRLPLAETKKPQPIALFLLLRDMRELESDEVPGLSPCWDHVIQVIQSRDIPLDPKDVKPPLERWKLHRWLKWAISQNVIDPADYFVPIRYLRVVSPFAECKESIVYDVYDEIDAKEYSNAPSKIEQSDKITRATKSQNTKNLFLITMGKEINDVSRWINFHKLEPYVTEVHVFYKLENFQWSVQVTGDVIKTINEDRKAISTKEIKKEKKDINDSPSKAHKFRDESLYLFCDSLEKKLFLISFCIAPKKKDVDSCIKKDYLTLEKYNFFKPNQLDQLVTISTIGIKSATIELEAGRQLLRIYRRSKFNLAVICSDTAFYLGNRAIVQQLMTVESQTIKETSRLISENLRKAYRSFGTKDYLVTLKDYYRSYMPSTRDVPSGKIDKNLRTLIHYFFMEEQIRLIREIFFDDDVKNILHALRIFFLNPNIRLEYIDSTRIPNTHQTLVVEKDSRIWYSLESNNRNILNCDQAATIIQSFFKMILAKKYIHLHDPNHVLHMQVRGELSKISDLFDPSLIGQLLRNIIKRHNSLRDLYPYSKDFIHVLNIQEFGGVLKYIKYDQWFPIARLVINSPPAETVFAAFELLTDLHCFALRVFDNQNRHEMMRIVNQVAPCRYKYRPAGYTMFAYGYSEKQRFKEINWTIRIITMKGEPMLHQMNEQRTLSSEIKPPELSVKELAAVYIPNAKNCISRWKLRAISSGIVSLKLTTSCSMVEIRMKITDKQGNILANVDDGSTILIPLVILKQSVRNNAKHHEVKNECSDVNKKLKNAKENLYYVEAFVLNNSWPLTEDEWAVVNRIKAKSTEESKTKIRYAGNAVSSRSDSSTTRRDSRQLANDGQALESPYWILQIVTDAKDAVEICQDTSREQEIALLKESLCPSDRDRSDRGKKLREVFLNTQISKIEFEKFLQQDKERSEIMQNDDMAFCLPRPKQRRMSKSPESYRLPALNLTKYMSADDVTADRWTKTESDEEISRNQRIIDIIDSQKSYSNYMEKLTELTSEQFRKYAKLFGKYEQSFWERRALVDAAYESRKAYLSVTAKMKKKNEKKM